jgi:hypothetical protein
MKKTAIILTVLAAVFALSACSGVIGGETSVVFSLSDGRHVSASASQGYVVALKKDKVYSLNQFEGEAFEYLKDDKVVIANLPVGEYVFGIILQDASENNVGFAVKEYEVKRGLNTLTIDVAPGVTNCSVQGISGDVFDLEDPPEEIHNLEFAEDTAIIDYDRPATPTVSLSVYFGDIGITGTDHTIIGGAGDGDPFTNGNAIPADADGVEFVYTAGGQDYTYRLILK